MESKNYYSDEYHPRYPDAKLIITKDLRFEPVAVAGYQKMAEQQKEFDRIYREDPFACPNFAGHF